MENKVERNAYERDPAIDLLKGVAIVLVVMGHNHAAANVTNLIYTFHMPLFMFLSGCTFWYSYSRKAYGSVRETGRYLLHRFMLLVVPCVTWTPISCAVFGRSLREEFADGLGSYWFLPSLFGIILIVSLAECGAAVLRAKDQAGGYSIAVWKELFPEAMIIGLLCGVTLLLMRVTGVKLLREIIIYIFPFYLGMAVKKYDFARKIYFHQATITICIILSALLIPHYKIDDKSYTVLLIRFITGITVTEVLYCYVYSRADRSDASVPLGWIERGLQYLGKRTLEIYLIAGLFRSMFVSPSTSGAFAFLDTLMHLICSVIACFMAVFIKKLICQSSVLSWVFFGRAK